MSRELAFSLNFGKCIGTEQDKKNSPSRRFQPLFECSHFCDFCSIVGISKVNYFLHDCGHEVSTVGIVGHVLTNIQKKNSRTMPCVQCKWELCPVSEEQVLL